MKQRIALLGSTGSIGEQTLDVVSQHPELFEITTLTANRRWEQLVAQARRFSPDSVVIADKTYYAQVSEALADTDVKVYAGIDAVAQVAAASNVDTVVNALVGYAGLAPSVASLRAGKKLALANKESLVVAGDIVMGLVGTEGSALVPIDSEHSAIFQCLVGEPSPVRRVVVTASGGSFRDTPISELHNVTVEQALRHPNWNMGAKITIDSSTLVNKAFEVIEARWLFGLKPEQIDVLIHPQSIIHSMVEFADGAIKAQLGTPDMRVPIQYALSFPHRLPLETPPFDFLSHPELTFRAVDRQKYPALDLAYHCLYAGGTSGCIFNAANEIAVAAFISKQIGYTDIVRTIENAFSKVALIAKPTLEDYAATNDQVRRLSEEYVQNL
ncbi:MAG: 1-deoxy-D-xylulose-5-phosphate reductoisomerase [Rikenellaceae bacterium]|nr:1-deoxy-D-xylulose-5-phosphate reductoisomerase [Rikenellaceae bacterium]